MHESSPSSDFHETDETSHVSSVEESMVPRRTGHEEPSHLRMETQKDEEEREEGYIKDEERKQRLIDDLEGLGLSEKAKSDENTPTSPQAKKPDENIIKKILSFFRD